MANGVSGTRRTPIAEIMAEQAAQITPVNVPGVQNTSTGGKIIDQGGGTWYGENDNGVAVAINDLDKSDYNLYKYGNKQVYEVIRYIGPEGYSSGATDPPKQYAFTKNEAMNLAKGWLKSNK